MSKNKLLLSISSLVLSCMLLIVGVFAWFADELNNKDKFILFSGDADVIVSGYNGNDEDKNSILDPIPGVDINALSRSEVIQNFYTPLQAVNIKDNYLPGSSIIYKIVIQNKSSKDSFQIKITFNELENYFYQHLDEFVTNYKIDSNYEMVTNESINNTLVQNSARLMFIINNLKATAYTKANENDDYSVKSNRVYTFTNTKYNMWQISANENFCDGDIILYPNELMEIDFTIDCQSSSIIYNNYEQYALDKYVKEIERRLASDSTLSQEQRTTIATKYCTNMTSLEINYLTQNDDNFISKEIAFNIEHMFVLAQIMPEEVGV